MYIWQSVQRLHLNLQPLPMSYQAFPEEHLLISRAELYEWRPPKDGDSRVVCPGLNAMANHGYLYMRTTSCSLLVFMKT